MKKLIKILIACTLAGLCLSGCGDDECVVCPDDPPLAEKEYRFLYHVGLYNWVYTFSTKTGLIVDSLQYTSGIPFWDVKFSEDGSLAYYGGDATLVTEFSTGDTVAIAPNLSSGWVAVSSDERYLLLGAPTLRIVELPSFSVIYEKAHRNSWGYGDIHPQKNVAYVPNEAEDSLLIVDFQTDVITDMKVPFFRSDGALVRASAVAVTNDGTKLILAGGIRIQIRDSETLDLLEEYPSIGWEPYLHPDGNRVFFLQSRDYSIREPGEVWVLNLGSGVMQLVLKESDLLFGVPYNEGLDPSDMDFTPDGRFAFIINGGGGGEGPGWGPIIKLNCDNYEIVDLITPPMGISRLIRINPQEISGGQ